MGAAMHACQTLRIHNGGLSIKSGGSLLRTVAILHRNSNVAMTLKRSMARLVMATWESLLEMPQWKMPNVHCD